MKNQKGVSLIFLVIVIVIIGIVIFVGANHAKDYIENEKDDDIKVTMLGIQNVITNINNKHIVDEENNEYIGIKVDLENGITEYNITENLKESLLSMEDSNLYILNKEQLKEHGIKDITINKEEFYVVDYNSGEIFYSLGIDGKYKLSEM